MLVLIAFVLALLLKTFLIQAFYIPSASMLPTLEISDRVLVNKVVYDLREPRRGEVVVFRQLDGTDVAFSDPSVVDQVTSFLSSGFGGQSNRQTDFIKRIIGLPGETLELRDGVVYIDGEPLSEDEIGDGGYLQARDLNDFGPVTVPIGEYFMMGDNRPNSADSRFRLGTIEDEDILGRAFVVIWPVARLDTLPIGDYTPLPDTAEAAPAAAGTAPPIDAAQPVPEASVAPAASAAPAAPLAPATP